MCIHKYVYILTMYTVYTWEISHANFKPYWTVFFTCWLVNQLLEDETRVEMCQNRQVILSDGSADSKIRSPLQTRQGESDLGYKAILLINLKSCITWFQKNKRWQINGMANCQPQLVGAHFYNHQRCMIVVVAVNCPNQAPHVRNPSDHPQRQRDPPARSKATWSFAPALA